MTQDYHFSESAIAMRPSEIRSLFAVANRPEIVSLAGGMPNLKHMPFKRIGKVVGKLTASEGHKMWQYGSAQGDLDLRKAILNITALEGVTANIDNVIACTGSQQALDFVTRIFINPGDVILAEAPNYVGALGAFVSYQANVQNVAMDESGLIPEELERRINELQGQGKHIKLLYTIPNFHNPGGVTLSEERRPQILEICKKYGVLILEDNPYGLLDFEGKLRNAIYSYDYDEALGFAPNVIYLGSFSKIIAPGMRVGWIIAPAIIKDKLVLSAESALLCPSETAQMTILAYLENFDWIKQIESYRQMYKENYETIAHALDEYLPECSYNTPSGGFYVWLKFPDGINTKEMLDLAIANGVAYVPGVGFYDTGEGTEFARLSYCYPEPQEIREGVKRLAKTYNIVKNDGLFSTKEYQGSPVISDLENGGARGLPPSKQKGGVNE